MDIWANVIGTYWCNCNSKSVDYRHIHLLLIFEDRYKPRTPAEIDQIVSAQLPDLK